MKKSELKALIREVVEQAAQQQELQKIIGVLEDKPEILDALMKMPEVKKVMMSAGGQLKENTRRNFLKMGAAILLGAGISAAQLQAKGLSALSDAGEEVVNAAREKSLEKQADTAKRIGKDLPNPYKDSSPGSTMHIIANRDKDSKVAKFKADYRAAEDDLKIPEMDKILKQAVEYSVEKLKSAKDYDKLRKDAMPVNVRDFLRFGTPSDIESIVKTLKL